MEFPVAFEVPDAALPVIDRLVSAEEIALVEALSSRVFDLAQAHAALSAAEPGITAEATEARVRSAYRRGVLRIEDEAAGRFSVSTFYDRLAVIAVGEPELFLALSEAERSALDAWCFATYVTSLSDEARPTSDRVMTLEETLEFLDTVDRPIWLDRCDCRTLAGGCSRPTDTCVSFRNGPNTLSHRGWSQPLTREEAKAVVRRSNAAGLVQTVNDDGICNCCGECCYLFRAQVVRDSLGVWPPSRAVAVFDADACIACGACVRRCPYDAFESTAQGIVHHPELCRGCALCVAPCPVSAIQMSPRP